MDNVDGYKKKTGSRKWIYGGEVNGFKEKNGCGR